MNAAGAPHARRFRWLASPWFASLAATVLFAVTACGAYILISKSGSVTGFSSSPGLMVFAAVLLVPATAAASLCRAAWRSASPRRGPGFWLPFMASSALVALMVVSAEMALRAMATPTPLGLRIGAQDLLPYDWSRVREVNQAWLRRTRGPNALFDVEDSDLGWNVAPGRQTVDGLYATSAEGLRSAVPGQALAAEGAVRRVALLGDSFTFGQEVPFEETWGEYLAGSLPAGTQVLNFGVPGHGVDQTLLKFRRDVLPWKPAVVVLGFLSASPLRNTSIYMFLQPDLELPFSKPRFRLEEDGRLELLNSPPEPAESLLARPSVLDLPLLAADSNFEARHWTVPLLGRSYVARYLATRFPRWTPRRERFPDDAIIALASRLLRQVATEVRAAGAVPLIVSLPVRSDLSGGRTPHRDGVVRDLAAGGIEVFDMGQCLSGRLPVDALFVPEAGRRSEQKDPGPAHYSAAGNAAVAACLEPLVGGALRPPG